MDISFWLNSVELAKVLAQIYATDLIRLQCYEGLDENKALYEWNYQKQLLSIQPRPLLKALCAPKKTVLLIDEIDKTDEEFEAFLFELLSDYQVFYI